MATAFEIVQESRRALVEQLIGLMEQGYFHHLPEWDRQAFLPQNPSSGTVYKGGNRLRLALASLENGYEDPRWMTMVQANRQGYHIRKGESGILCEKWIFDEEVWKVQEDGTRKKERVPLEFPKVRYFVVYNARQIQDFPLGEEENLQIPQEKETLIADVLRMSDCKIYESAQPEAYYNRIYDYICVPKRSVFKDYQSFLKTVLHEEAHATGHSSRLNREMSGMFGSPAYAKEELRAEIGAMFTAAELGIPYTGEHYEDHSDYVKSWMQVLREDPNELFRACRDAEQIADWLCKNYQILKKEQEIIEDVKQEIRTEKVIESGRKEING